MNKKQKKVLIRVIVASVLLILCAVLPTTGYVRFATFMVPYLVIGYDILKKAWKGILNKQVFDENFLMAVALFFRQSTDCFKKQLWRDFLPGFLKDGFGGFTFEIFIKRMKLPRFV